MIQFNFENKEYKMTTNWKDITLRQFIRFNKIRESNTILPVGEEMLAQQLIECLCGAEVGEFDTMSWGQATELYPYLVTIINDANNYNNNDYTFGPDFWQIEDKFYSFHKNPNSYTLGDVSDIKTYIQNKKNEWDYLGDIAAIMIRPATKETTEAGTEFFRLTKRTPFDHQPNKEVVLDFKLTDVTRVVNFFLIGLTEQNQDTQSFLKVKEVVN